VVDIITRSDNINYVNLLKSQGMVLKSGNGTDMVVHRTDRNQALENKSCRGVGGGSEPQNPMIYFPL